MGVRLPVFVKGHELRCGPQGASDPQRVEGGLEMWDMVFLGASPFSANQGPVLSLPVPKLELWELCEIPNKGVLHRRESSGQTQGLDLAS